MTQHVDQRLGAGHCCGLEWSRDENGNKTYYAYDGANRLSKSWTDVQGNATYTGAPLVQYTYDAFGNQQTVTTRSDSSTSRATGYTYDSANRVTKIEYPGEIVGDEEFGYDDAGGLLWKKDGNGKFTLYEYDDLRRLIAVYYLAGALPNPISYQGLTADVTYTYHGGTNQRESMTDAAGESGFEYDSQGRLKTYTPPLGLDTGYYVEYAYNKAGQKTGVKIWNGTTASYNVSYEYYANGWLKAVKYGGNTIASYSYDAVGNRTQIDYGNGTYTTFDYESGDPRYRLDTITHKYGAMELAKFGYMRDNVGNPLSISWRENSTTYEWEYGYDAMNRLASAAPPEEGPLLPLPAQAGGTYSYDWVGNMKAAASSNPWQYNAADQLTLWPGMHSYEYDDNGALTAVKMADGQTEQQTFSYHPTGLLNEATFNNQTQTLTNLWDADEHRVQFSIGEDEYTAVFDVTAGIPAVIKENTPQGTVYYVREPGGELICRVATVGETTHKWFYHFDELGSTRLITDDSTPAAVTDSYSYDAYGAVIYHDRNTGTLEQPYQYVGQLGYYTHYQAPELGWLQLGVRFYEPETGRFERRDPVDFPQVTPYGYADLRPLASTDPWGLETLERCLDRCEKRFLQTMALAHLSLATAHISCIPYYIAGPEAYLACLGKRAAYYAASVVAAGLQRGYCRQRCREPNPPRCGRVWYGQYNDDEFFPGPPRRLQSRPPGFPRRER